jgi:sugar (pentulose or hexulose) kinase
MQMIADIYGVKAIRNKVNGAAAMGSAICVAVATGLYTGYSDAVSHMIEVKDEFTPNMENHKLYEHFNNKAYKDLPKMMEPTLKAIYAGLNEE